MPYRCLWDEEVDKLYRVEFYDEWTWDDYKEAYTTAYDMLGKLDYTVDMVQALLSKFPEGSAIMHLEVAGKQPPNVRHTVIVNATGMTDPQLVEYLIGAVQRMKGWQGPKFVSDFSEARGYIKELRETP